jgi:hypothetical protein
MIRVLDDVHLAIYNLSALLYLLFDNPSALHLHSTQACRVGMSSTADSYHTEKLGDLSHLDPAANPSISIRRATACVPILLYQICFQERGVFASDFP